MMLILKAPSLSTVQDSGIIDSGIADVSNEEGSLIINGMII
jgi:hypothetical protein